MIVWSPGEIAVFSVVGLMIVLKLWTVWHVSIKAKANREGKMIFLGLISGLALFGIGAKVYIGSMMAL
ncbi:hypothetical protein [Oceanospirillum linum]|uniref:DUF2788 domain-containing protein n=1 Tax=Oceanospirillum linum TaxID=966 RepID=A0A1T1HCM0_OCELI|nr:hypothetical protein [Oceanospirillum linum]OOV87585.1 hypothetical protein BTA35_0205980 [Oceanospirillum linum]SEF92573.1 hypothetical protein SAMN04489856_103163 [Oleiphilus messinensis]SMP12681.1 hypothetical protein SAMN06264348_102377 [Oceanospirillum linum]